MVVPLTPYYDEGGVTLYLGDCREVMRMLPDASVDAIVTDPPYELGFMGKGWDASGIANSVEVWREALRVLKPGGHLAAFGGTRTHHRMACAVDDAGFEIRDSLCWLYGSGFPKSLDVIKAIDRAAGAEREIVGITGRDGSRFQKFKEQDGNPRAAQSETITAPATDAARQWDGWGTALKPAYEPIVLARKPLAGTVAANVLAYGTGAINVDGCRVGTTDDLNAGAGDYSQPEGRWPANVLLDEEAAALLDEQTGVLSAPRSNGRRGVSGVFEDGLGPIAQQPGRGDDGGPSRFFYTAKASRSEREAGLDGMGETRRSDGRDKDIENPRLRTTARRNDHPTVKPLDLMAWLCRLVTPPGGLILDPFNGSGSTGLAALDGGFRYIGIDLDQHYLDITRERINHRHLIAPVTREPSAEAPVGRLL